MKKNTIILSIILIALLALLIFTKNDISSLGFKTELFPQKSLIEDYYVIDDSENNKIYENKIYIPKYMTKEDHSLTEAVYMFNNTHYSIRLEYDTYFSEEKLNESFIESETFAEESFYHYLEKDNLIKIYFKNQFNYYQTIRISLNNKSENEYKIDKSYKNLLKNLTSKEKNKSDYSIKKTDGYYKGTIKYNYYYNENNKTTATAEYNVNAEKYGSSYDVENGNQVPYLNPSRISFYEGKITSDPKSVKTQTRIYMYLMYINKLNLKQDAIDNLNYPLNQTAFKDVKEDMVKIETESYEYNKNKIQYNRIISDNNNAHNERINAYILTKNNVYYVIQIIGGDGKELNKDMINDFIPTKTEAK